MKRTKSSISLQNLAMSIKNSIVKTSKRQFVPIKTTRSTLRLKDAQNASEKVFRETVLGSKIAHLQEQLRKSQTTVRDYNRELQEYDRLNQLVIGKERQLQVKGDEMRDGHNQLLMIREDILSHDYNIQERIAEKEYYEELLHTYANQYEAEAELVLALAQDNIQIQETKRAIQQAKTQLEQSQEECQRWKSESDFDLNQHKLKNKIVQLRTELIAKEEATDVYCEGKGLRKIRELFCSFLKGQGGIRQCELDEGLEIYACRKGLVERVIAYVSERLTEDSNPGSCIANYLSTLRKMSSVIQSGKVAASNKQLDMHLKQINQKTQVLHQLEEKAEKCEKRIKAVRQSLDLQQANENVAIIEYLRSQNKNKYDLKEIKAKLKNVQKDSQLRIGKMQEIVRRLRCIDTAIDSGQAETGKLQVTYTTQIARFEKTSLRLSQQIKEIGVELTELSQDKNAIEEVISNAVTRWKERDVNKNKLKSLYRQLKYGRGQFELQKIQAHSEKQGDASYKPSYSKRSEANCYQITRTKSVLCLGNPFKRCVQPYKQTAPVLKQCDLGTSKILLPSNWTRMTTADSNSGKERKIKIERKDGQRENSQYYRKPSESKLANRYRLIESERVSLSRMLVSKFKRIY